MIKSNVTCSQAIVNCPAITSTTELMLEVSSYRNVSTAPTKKQGHHSGDRMICDKEALADLLREWNNMTWDSWLLHYHRSPLVETKDKPAKELIAKFYCKPFTAEWGIWHGYGITFFNYINSDVIVDPMKGLQEVLDLPVLLSRIGTYYVRGRYELLFEKGYYNLYKIIGITFNV